MKGRQQEKKKKDPPDAATGYDVGWGPSCTAHWCHIRERKV